MNWKEFWPNMTVAAFVLMTTATACALILHWAGVI